MNVRWRAGAFACWLAISTSVANAQTVVTAIDFSQGWGPVNRFAGPEAVVGSQQIDGTYARSGNGSIHFSGSGGARNRVALLNTSAGGFGLLKDLSNAGFDWFRSSSSTTGGIQAPAFRLFVADGLSLTELIWEFTYNSAGNAPTDAWQTVDIGLNSGKLWSFGIGGYQNTTCSFGTGPQLTATIQGFFDAGCLSENAFVYGISLGLGTLPDAGSFDGAVDNARIQFGTAAQQSWNFETTSVVPEPSTYLLMASGLAGLGFVAGRRRA